MIDEIQWNKWRVKVFCVFLHPLQKLPNGELSEIVLKELRRRYNGRSSMQQTELETAQQSMELMRENIQHLFNSEIQMIVQKYIEVIH